MNFSSRDVNSRFNGVPYELWPSSELFFGLLKEEKLREGGTEESPRRRISLLDYFKENLALNSLGRRSQ
jgi:hypothetical protein